jgi:hypothetical protein
LTKTDNKQPEQTKRVGEVHHDARGNAVWQWATETARNAAISTSQLLRRLDVSSLSLEDSKRSKAPSEPASSGPSASKPASNKPSSAASRAGASKATTPAPRAAGYDPYAGAAVRPSPAKVRAVAARPTRTSWWRRLFQRR